MEHAISSFPVKNCALNSFPSSIKFVKMAKNLAICSLPSGRKFLKIVKNRALNLFPSSLKFVKIVKKSNNTPLWSELSGKSQKSKNSFLI